MTSILQDTLSKQKNFEALALIDMSTRDLLFLEAADDAPVNLLPALERFLQRIAHDTESHQELTEVNKVIYYDIAQRQVISNLIETGMKDYILVVVAAPKKAYKQATKRLIKQLKTALD